VRSINAVWTRARVARRVVALLLVVAGVLAASERLNVTGGVLGDLRFAATLGSSSSAGLGRRRFCAAPRGARLAAHDRHRCRRHLLAGQIMVSSGYWQAAPRAVRAHRRGEPSRFLAAATRWGSRRYVTIMPVGSAQ
jgi:hypothetical protein